MNKTQKKKYLIFGLFALAVVFGTLVYVSIDWDDKKVEETEPAVSMPSSSVTGTDSFEDLELKYKILIHGDAIKRIEKYKMRLNDNISLSGHRLRAQLKKKPLNDLTTLEFIESLLATKVPRVFAERQSYGSSEEWSPEDARVLGDMSVVMPVKVFDNGQCVKPKVHSPPFDAYLMYTPGALFIKGCGVDYPQVVGNGNFDDKKYFELYERRLLPSLRFASDEAGLKGTKAIVTVPGIGCGCFSGPFANDLPSKFDVVLRKLLEKYVAQLPNISLVYFGVYSTESVKDSQYYGNIRYMRIGSSCPEYLNLLESPAEFGKDYKDHVLFSFVAWDHVSFPGNDFFDHYREKDGVKAASTSSMTSLLGVEGEYHVNEYKYLPKHYPDMLWSNVAQKARIVPTEGRLHVLKTESGKISLEPFKE